ncbi:MAG: tetratricopeptide repeat protein [Phycisphaeraceae bacterium]
MIHATKTRKMARRISHAALLLTATCLATVAFAESAFDEQREKLSLATVTHPEASIDAMLKAGLEEDKPTQALALTERWLRQNAAKDPMLLFHAGKAAELAGDWTAAVALYRQYLKRADLRSDTASEAILASYTLQINHLDSPEGAYAFAKVDGHPLVVNAQARQFDRWFLDEAKRRRDHEAVADRLLALTQAKVSGDLLIALYESDYRWLLATINDGRLDQARYSQRFVETTKALAKATTFDKELALLLDWSVSVKAYNMAILDGEQAAAPLAEAKALLAAYPRHAERVQTGWAGGNRGPHYRGDSSKYWTLDQADKLAPVIEAAAKLGPIEQARFYQSYGTSYYSGKPQIVPVNEAAAWVLDNSKLANSKAGPILFFNWHGIKAEDAKKIAPSLAKNPSPEAAGIRALASVNNIAEELDKAVDNLLKQEAWRLNPNELPSYIDRLWHHAGRPDGNALRDQLINRGKQAAQSQKNAAVQKEQPVNQRLATVRNLWNDYKSNQPKLIGVRPRLVQALQLTPEALPELLRDPSFEARMLTREVMHSGRLESTDPAWAAFNSARHIYTDRYAPCFNEQGRRHYGGMSRFLQNKEQYRPHPLGPTFHALLEDQLKKGQAEPWVVFGWLNTQFPEDNAKSVALMQKLLQSPAWKTLPFEARFGAQAWFKDAAMSEPQSRFLAMANAELICKPLLDLTAEADAATAVAALKTTIDGLQQSPVRHEILGMDRLGKLKPEVGADPLVLEQLMVLAGPMRSFATDHTTTYRLFQAISKEPDPEVAHRVAAYLWRDVEVSHRLLAPMMEFAEQLGEVSPSASHAMASIGLQTIARHKRGHTYYNRDADIPRLQAIRGKAAVAMNLVEIPVSPNHPAYPVYQSQSEYLIGNVGTARQLYVANADQLLPIHRQLSVPYLLWALQSTIDNREEARQEELVKALLAWVQETPNAFTVEQRIALDIAYGDIALQRGMLPEAQQIFARARSNEAYAASFDRHAASLRLVRVQRIARDFDAALQTLMELDSEKVPRLTTEAHFARAEVYYDMEEYLDSADEIAKVLERDPEHADAKILQGRVYLKRQKLIEATEVELGSTTKLPSLVPGQMLKVTLNDPTLAVSSGSSDIEVVVWATSGDKEYLLLRQFGDQKTKYRGDVRTALGKPAPDDGMLQVVGDDEVYYAYSERFREKMVNLEENRGGPIQVASDAMLMASARKLLSENEQRVADMQRLTSMLNRNEDQEALKRTSPERYAMLQAEAERRNRRAMLETRVKPGNPIHLRVIDPDRGRTAEIDELPVSVSTSSGDLIGRVVLTETGTHTGQFEGKVTTTAAQAMAFASSSEAGRNPNMVISPKRDYPVWRPIEDSQQQHQFTVDLNDNVELGALTVTAKEQGARLKAFIVQTGMNSADMTTVAVYPKNPIAIDKPWHPSVVVMNDTDQFHNNNNRSVYDLEELKAHVSQGWIKQQFGAGTAGNVAGISEAFTPEIPARVKWLRNNRHHNSHVIYRFRAYFYEPVQVTRRFKLDLGSIKMPEMHPSVADPAQFLLAVNGRRITDPDKPNQLEGQINLRPGVHMFEIWATGWDGRIGFGRTPKLMANLAEEEALIDCPDQFFDPATFPEGVLDHRNAPATITADEGAESFQIEFASDSRARLIRLLFVDQEGTVPALNELTLKSPGGDVLLPVAEDFAELRKNDVLEILTGDKVAVRYLDDRFVTSGKERHERLLNVAFTDATVEFADIEPRISQRSGELEPYHETLLRFPVDKPLSVVVNDADMDETTEPDTLVVSVTNGKGETKQLTATETGPSTGTFRAWITPTTKATQAKDQIQIVEGETLVATYVDRENLKPGVPYERVGAIKHGAFSTPRIEIAHATLKPYEQEPGRGPRVSALNEDQEPAYWARQDGKASSSGDAILTRFNISQRFLGMDEAPEGGLAVVHGRMALIDVIAPHLAMGASASVEVFVQTDSGRKKGGQGTGSAFDVNVPGTLVYTSTLNAGSFRPETRERGGYIATFSETRGNDYERARMSMQEGRFRLAVPLIAGLTPAASYSDREAFYEESRDTGERYPFGLVAKAGEKIHIGVKYKDASGKTQWSTASAKVIAQPMLDVLREDFRETISEAYVGEKLFVRVVDPFEDRTPERDELRVYMQTKSGQKHYATLSETDFNSGVFKGVFQLTFAEAQEGVGQEGYDVGRMGMPVKYGDAVGIRYTDAMDRKTSPHFIAVAKGSDGMIAPFSKQYDDAETAMQTQFAMAESFLELARRHRKLGEEDAAKREFLRARQLLANTVAQFNDPDTRSHAEYLLGNLTMEDAEATEDKQLQADRYQAALARYMKVTGSYPDSEYASRAQFKTAVIYERLGEPDIAAQEYVKLAYKYPDSEHLATSMARLGTHFQRKAVTYEKQAKPLLEDEEKKDDFFEGTALKKLSQLEYVKAAQIFERLQQRFPSHELAGTAGLRAGQIYMRAEDLPAAVKALENVFNDESYDGPTLRCEAMYWAGRCYVMQREELLAYSLFKRITYDFPESKWAAYARSQLSSEQMLNLDKRLEIERLEAGQ